MTPDAGEETVVALYREPPDTGLHLERRLPVAQRDPDDLAPARLRSAVERGAKACAGRIVAPRGIGRIRAQLRPECRGMATRPVACLTSARGGAHAGHEAVEAPRVLLPASIGAGERSRLSVERISRGLKRGVE